MADFAEPGERTPASPGLRGALWTAQVLVFVLFAGTGVWKLLTPIPELARLIPWAGQVSPSFLHLTAVFDLLGGIGVLLPSLTRVAPRLSVFAALGCAALQVCAIVFHASRGEAAKTPFNGLLVVLCIFVCWGRGFRAPVVQR